MEQIKYGNNRKYYINQNYFDNIDNEQKAYWLGFLWADGNISKTSDTSKGPNRMRLSQKISEIKHLQLFKNDIQSEHQIKYVNNNAVCQLDINSRKLCKSLQYLGFDIKEKRVDIPKIPKELIRHFIRGYFDGDGCISVYQQIYKKWNINRQEFSFTGKKEFLLNIKKIFEDEISTTKNLKLKTYKKTNKAVTLRYGKQSDIEKIYKYLYHDANIYLESKHNNFLKYFSRKNKG